MLLDIQKFNGGKGKRSKENILTILCRRQLQTVTGKENMTIKMSAHDYS